MTDENLLLLGPNGCGKSTVMAALAGKHGVVIHGELRHVACSEADVLQGTSVVVLFCLACFLTPSTYA